MARPTAAQRQARAAQQARERAAEEKADQSRAAAAVSALAGEPWGAATTVVERPLYDPLLTVDQVSDWLGIPKGTLYQWRSRNQGPRAIKVGGGLRYRRSEIDRYLDRHTDARPA